MLINTFRKQYRRLAKPLAWGLVYFLVSFFPAIAVAAGDPEGVLDSFYVECSQLAGDSVALQIRFFSDNTDTNRVQAFGLPILVSVSNNALVLLDTSLATTYGGSMIEAFDFTTTSTTNCCGGSADPSVSPVHFVMGALNLSNGITGAGLFATLAMALTGDTCTITVDTLSAGTEPSLVTEMAAGYTPGWKAGGFLCQATDVGDHKDNRSPAGNLPARFSLSQNHPNPFNASTVIRFALPKPDHVKLEIFNALGQRVKVLLDEQMNAGFKEIVWDGKDQEGRGVASGIYFYRINTSSGQASAKKMVMLR